jgi:hypothetical protein
MKKLLRSLDQWVNGMPHLFDLYYKEMTIVVGSSLLVGAIIGASFF